jgi:glycosyltransferase involved in cell wall biosynthesis
MSGIKVSVLTPVYNTNIEHLRQCIDSILNQTFTDFEFIILNDSPENLDLESVILSYRDTRIKYYKNDTNIGISKSRNKLLELACGEYIAIFDHDDISVPDRLSRQVEYMDTHPNIGVISGWLQNFESNDGIFITPENDKYIKVALTEDCFIAHTAAMIRKSVLTENNIKYESEYTPCEDYRLWAKLMDITEFYNIQDILVKYRWHQNNTTNNMSSDMKQTHDIIRNQIIQQHPELRNIYNSWHITKVIVNIVCLFIPIASIRRRLRKKLKRNFVKFDKR